MGATHSNTGDASSLSSTTTYYNKITPLPASALGLPAFRHAIILNGLSGSGKSAVQSALELSDTRVLEVDQRFLTTPQIYSAASRGRAGPNAPTRSGGLNGDEENFDRTVWRYGGRGSFYARWQSVAGQTKAVVFTVDATDRARLCAPPGFTPLPSEFVANITNRTTRERAEILTTLVSQLNSRDLLLNLLKESQYSHTVLILVTHSDQPGAMSVQEVHDALGLSTDAQFVKALRYKDWRIAACNALTGEGLHESIDWLNYMIAHPTDFSAARDAEYKSLQPVGGYTAAYSEKITATWAKERAETKRLQDAREAKFASGYIFRAPKIWRTNGTVFVPTKEQTEGFVCPPMLKEEEVKENVAAVGVDGGVMNVKGEEERQRSTSTASSSSSSADNDDTAAASSSSSSSLASSLASSPASPASETESDSDSESESSASDNDDSSPQQRAHSPEAQQKVVDEVLNSKKTLAPQPPPPPPFTSLQSSALTLPPSASIPFVLTTPYKKHWYSRTKLRVVEDQTKDIHEIGRPGKWDRFIFF